MNRRHSLKLLALGSGLVAAPTFAAQALPATITIYDGRFAEARTFARDAHEALDCQRDAAALWYGVLAVRAAITPKFEGLTTSADALILVDCARAAGLRLERLGQPTGPAQLVRWRMFRKGFA